MKLKDFTTVNLESAAPQTASEFLDNIPPEIRNRIYELVFKSSLVTIGGQERRGKPKAPGILLACKQVYGEAIKLYWSKSSFLCKPSGQPNPRIWLGNIKRRRRELLSEVLLETNRLIFYPGDWDDEIPNQRSVKCVRDLLLKCRGEQRGVRPGVLKVNLQLVDPETLIKTRDIWTSDPKGTAAPFLKGEIEDDDEEGDD